MSLLKPKNDKFANYIFQKSLKLLLKNITIKNYIRTYKPIIFKYLADAGFYLFCLNFRFSILSRRKKIITIVGLLFILFFYQILPRQLFNDPLSTVLVDRNQRLLGVRIAADGQWRFPASDTIPEKYKTAVIQFEDNRFYYHWGFDIISLTRAFVQNIKARKIISGGSTIPMQVIRISRKNQSRTIAEKLWEILLAIRLEFSFHKKDIFALYANNAPFGGNIVGIEAAAWRYFGRSASELSWAESCLLAVLPNSPALIHPGKNRILLTNKRNTLLHKLYLKKIIDKETYSLALDEPIPDKPRPMPVFAPHLLLRVEKDFATKNQKLNQIVKTTIDVDLQQRISQIVNNYSEIYSGNQINNAAALVIDVATGNAIAYVGNSGNIDDKKHGCQVDVIMADRSTGSVLKPLLYAGMLTSGEILPNALVPDIPTQIGGYAPENYNLGYDGAVPAHRALARSLNVPAVKMLQSFGVDRFHFLLKKLGMTSITKPPNHYGLSLILGGCEGKLWDLCSIYASMARTLNNYDKLDFKYNKSDFRMANYLTKTEIPKPEISDKDYTLSASAIWFTFKAMLDVERPDDENQWQSFGSSQRIAWKTGTSFGFRDAWAIGITPRYVVGVWIGNADGEGRPELVGVKAAAPVLFEIFGSLPKSSQWFAQPFEDMIKTTVCRESGYLASENCEHVDTVYIPQNGTRFQVCPFHKIIHLDKTGKFRVNSDCESTSNMQHVKWFILPPAMEWFFKSKNAFYKTLPPYRADCLGDNLQSKHNAMQIIYPDDFHQIYVPKELDGSPGAAIFEVAHRNPNTIIFWHIDQEYIGQTQQFHKMGLHPSFGKHVLTLVDENGEKLTVPFEVISK